jgi:mono/diheme cytochrome c family protein
VTDQPTEGKPGSDDEPITAGAESEEPAESAPAAAAASASVASTPPPAAPPARPAGPVEPPYVAAAKARKRVPLWAVPIFPLLIIWALVYVNAMQPQAKTNDPIAQGGALYAKNCATCHGTTGGGGTGPSFNAGAVIKTFPKWEDQVQWVDVGAANWPSPTYGAQHKSTGTKGMPGFGPDGQASLTCDQILLVVHYERVVLAGHTASTPDDMDLEKQATAVASGQTSTQTACPVKK